MDLLVELHNPGVLRCSHSSQPLPLGLPEVRFVPTGKKESRHYDEVQLLL